MTSGPDPARPHDDAPPAAGTPGPAAEDRQAYTLRRAPRLGAVAALAALLGVLAGSVAALLLHRGVAPFVDPLTGAPVMFGTTLGYTAVVGALAGGVLGLLVWLLMDRRSRAAQDTVVLERTDDPGQADVSLSRSERHALRPDAADSPSGRTPQP